MNKAEIKESIIKSIHSANESFYIETDEEKTVERCTEEANEVLTKIYDKLADKIIKMFN